ncbi:MAG: hypothetical protein K1X67_15125 [Fimbriimonadaceae bacterium]|nr:hypothetical protein [Fimbriimonadaceae bacterium]
MSCITNCLEELRAKRQQVDEAIIALERLSAGGGAVKRRGRPPQWLRAAQAQSNGDTDTAPAERKPRAVKAAPKKATKRQMSAEGKLAIQGVALRQWKAANPEAGEEDVAKQRERIRQQLVRKGA